MNSYSGDKEFLKTLHRIGAILSLGEVKSFLMGTIAATNHAPMQVVFDHITGGAEIEDESQARHFMTTLMGLWNELAEHQNADKPFQFSTLRSPAYPGDIKAILSSRTAEIKQFIKGLDAGGTDPQEFSKDGQNSFRYLAEADAILLGVMRVSETDKDTSETTLKTAVDNLRKVDEIIHDCVHRIILEAKEVRLRKIGAMKEKEKLKEQTRHIGRNDPCPCGSGIKFKKCCSLKHQ